MWKKRSGWACYNLEGAKKLKLYEAECSGAKEKLALAQPLLIKYVKSLNAYEASVVSLSKALRETKLALSDQIKVSDSSESLRQEAEYWSITGNMLPWVITGAVLAFSSGYLVAETLD